LMNPKAFLGDDIINDNGTDQTLSKRIGRGKKLRFYIPVQNEGTTPDAFVVTGAGGTGDFDVRYYLGAKGDIDVTDAVVNGTYQTSTLAIGAIQNDATMLRMEVIASKTVLVGVTNSIPVTFVSSSDVSKVDQVRATVFTK